MTIFQDSAEARERHRERDRELEAAASVAEAARSVLAGVDPDATARLAEALAAYVAAVESHARHHDRPDALAPSHPESRPVFSRDRDEQTGGWRRGRPHGPRRG